MALIGSTLEVTGLFPTMDNIDFGPFEIEPRRGPDDFEFIALNGVDESWDITSNQIRITFIETITAGNAETNAWRIVDLGNTLPDIASISLVGRLTSADWDDSMIRATDSEIIIDYVRDGIGVSVTEGQELTVKVTFDPTSGSNRNDMIVGTEGRDTLLGLRGRDTISGNDGADRLNGGRGADTLEGGRGRDDFIFKGRTGNDIIEDFQSGRDEIILRNWGVGDRDDLSISDDGTDLILSNGTSFIRLSDLTGTTLDTTDIIFA